MKTLRVVKDYLPYLIVASMAVGLAYGYGNDTSYLSRFLKIVVFIMVYPMMINLKVTDFLEALSTPKPILLSLLVNFVVSPAIAFGLGRAFFSDNPMLALGLVLIALIPTSGMTASWTGLANGNMKTALVIISANLILAIVATPLYLGLLMGKTIVLDTMMVVGSLVQVVVIPLFLGDLTRRFLIRRYGMQGFNRLKPNFGGISAIGVLMIVFIATSMKSKSILGDGQLVLDILIPMAVYYAVILVTSDLLGRRFLDYGDRVALIYGTSMRNLTIAMALVISSTGGGLAVVLIAVGYLLQVPFAALYMRYLNWAFSRSLSAGKA